MSHRIILITIALLASLTTADAIQSKPTQKASSPLPYAKPPDVFPGTKPLTPEEDRSIRILDNAHLFIEEKIRGSKDKRSQYWKRDFTSPEAYDQSVAPNRQSLMKMIGVEDKEVPMQSFKLELRDEHPPIALEKYSVNGDPLVIAETPAYRVYQVRWPVLQHVNGEGLLIEPRKTPIANVVAIPDADQTPEQLAGLAPGIAPESQFARRLAENGYQVLIPVLVNRNFLFPGTTQQQTHREWIYRQAFHMGRHIIGYEVQKVLSAVDWFKHVNGDRKVGVAGYHEGGLIAFYAAALDTRIDAALVSGYFNSRENTWNEPLYRNIDNLLTEFGDAEIATLIAPRPLVVEHSAIPEFIERSIKPGEPEEKIGQWPYTGYKGTLKTPDGAVVSEEYKRVERLTKRGFMPGGLIAGTNTTALPFGSQQAIERFTSFLSGSSMPIARELPRDQRKNFDAAGRQIRQVKEMEDHIQMLMRDSDYERNRFFLYSVMPEFEKRTWSTKPVHPSHSPDRFIAALPKYRKIFQEEIIGRFDDPMLPANPHTRKLYDNERWSGYEVQMDVFPNLQAAGILLIPKDLKDGERRPVVVCQHGRDGFPQRLIEDGWTAYNHTASKLADQGFIVYAPYNPYRGEEKYRWLVRKAASVGKSMFSFIIPQHDQTLQWLSSLPFVDAERIAFYGLSFGGETAMRVPSILEGYCLSICSGDFGDYTRKVVDTHFSRGFMNSMEWEIPVFNMGSTFSHAELAYLIFPRPFMVERGHDDLVQQTEWVAYEYGKVKYLYDQFGLSDKTAIEFFNGGHSMRGEGSFDFLHKHLNWPKR
jgi:dienelactone hydrolase